MDTSDLFASCRKGDVGRVRYLLEQRDVEVLCLLVWARGAGTLPSGQWSPLRGQHLRW
ncbi:ABTB1 isoform 12 [Pan troglodytes]|uniref:Ankyrin repeat and BTB domain containing 1 n=2 Tax=Homininae TaxID=207598 RepID=F2Z3F5_HUMAN|nr:ankyrin repeat and BTB domain containing 1 [Homo sapiens]PNI32080.1 ABTB1 isoform 1 [Pan troglodytes]KAI2531327.1 ankyrin repeat and BTB domain containing 1 [Homo sapiens]KAI4031394.1 ankyrin repeat and BTB domain containing 1 [Homo sapiens]KAI4031397.1 ankyrin repeat and BTB domain containing 1 [Homo sapiens]